MKKIIILSGILVMLILSINSVQAQTKQNPNKINEKTENSKLNNETNIKKSGQQQTQNDLNQIHKSKVKKYNLLKEKLKAAKEADSQSDIKSIKNKMASLAKDIQSIEDGSWNMNKE